MGLISQIKSIGVMFPEIMFPVIMFPEIMFP